MNMNSAAFGVGILVAGAVALLYAVAIFFHGSVQF